MPDLAKITTKMMETIEKKLSQVDAALCSKLQEEAERAEKFQMQQENSLDWLKLFHEKMGNMGRDLLREMLQQQVSD